MLIGLCEVHYSKEIVRFVSDVAEAGAFDHSDEFIPFLASALHFCHNH